MLQIFKNKFFIILLVTLALFIVMGVSSREDSKLNVVLNAAGNILSPIQQFFTSSGNGISNFFTYFEDVKKLTKENKELREKVDQLADDNRKLQQLEDKNKELREALNIKDQFGGYDTAGANIIAKDAGNWFNIFKIDRGTKDGVENNFPVITNKGLVGLISQTDLLSSKVMALIDSDTMISARLSKTRELVRIRGDITLKDQGLCLMDHIPLEADVTAGDMVETSGVGGIYPKGITVGKVKEIRKVNGELSRYAVIEPSVDFKRLEEVIVLKSKANTTLGTGIVEK